MNTSNKFTKTIAVLLCIALLSTMLTGCGSKAQALTSDAEYVTVAQEKIWQEHTDALADISYQMFRKVAAQETENIVMSPLSAWFALSMTGQGANGETEEEFAWFSKRMDDDLQADLAAWMMEYLEQTYGADNESVQVGVANSVWVDDAMTVNTEFVDIVKAYYRAQVISQDLQAHGAVDNVNNWISDATKERIQNMLDQIDANAVMLLINALTLDAKWQTEFDIANTHEGVFYLPDGKEVNKDFMHRRITNGTYLSWDGGEGVVLPYQGENMAMIALLPDANSTYTDVIDKLSSAWLYDLQDNRTECIVQLSMPKFKMESKLNLNDMCQKMGLELAFDAENADFSNLGAADNGTNIYIGRVLQNCMLEVGEEGTKAAAATVVEMRCGSAFIDPSKIVNLTLDRPFVYLVVDTETQIPLFTGVYQGE